MVERGVAQVRAVGPGAAVADHVTAELALGRLDRLVDLPGYGYANVPPAERRAWLPMLDALRTRASLKGLFVVVDARRGLKAEDEALFDWTQPEHGVHVLLSKADKLNRTEATRALKSAQAAAGTRASAQLFSALHGTGLDEARRMFLGWLADTTARAAGLGEVSKGAETKRPR